MNQRHSPVLWMLYSIIGGVLLSLLVVSGAAAHNRAQTAGGAYAVMSRLDQRLFPKITGQLFAYQVDGSFADTLEVGQVTILEGGERLPVDTLDLQTPGVQFVLAVLGGSDLAFRDTEGRSRLDDLLEGTAQWETNGDGAAKDDLSLIVQGGTELLHERSTAKWLEAVQGIDQDSLRQIEPDLQILSRALAAAAATPPAPGMGKALLVITPAVNTRGLSGVQSLASTAQQEGVRISIWLVASQEYGGSILSNGLRLLAAETGGSFFNYSGVEAIPELQGYLNPLRHNYLFSYTSAIRSSGVYTVSAEIQSDTFNVRTDPLEISVALSAPNPIFASLPAEITRQVITASLPTASAGSPLRYEPEVQTVHIVVEFPDGIRREIVQSTLLVNGQAAAVNTAPPFNQFNLDLTPYTESGQVLVRVEVVDALGLKGSSAEFQVTITVIGPPPPSPTAIIMTPQGALALLLSAVALGAVMGLVLLVSGRIQLNRNPLTGKANKMKRPGQEAPTPAPGEPGGRASGGPGGGPSTKPLANPRSPTSGLPGCRGRVQKRMQTAQPDAPVATLTPIVEGEEGAAPPLLINVDECILGSDLSRTTWAIKDPSLAPVHARIYRQGSGFRLVDENTTSGTWVNYETVPPEGRLLSHGDAVHFGRIGFRFGLRGENPKKPVVTPLKKKFPF